MPIKIYEYNKCSTCRKALQYLDSKKVNYECLSIIEQPPTLSELRTMLAALKADGLGLKNLFNTSGQVYRELGVAGQLKAGLSESEALKLLAANGKLIKRPFLVTPKGGTVGFKPAVWQRFPGTDPLEGDSQK